MKYLNVYNIFVMLVLVSYGSNMYKCGLKPVFQQGKWVLLILMIYVLISKSKRIYEYFAVNVFASLLVIIFFSTSFIFAFFYSIVMKTSILYICGLVITFIVAYKIANYFSYPVLRWKFFEILLLLAQIITYSNFVMLLLGINKGRAGLRFSGWTGNPNGLSMMLVPLFPVVLYYAIHRRNYRLLSERLLLIMMVILLFAAGTRGSTLGVVCSSTVILWYSKKWRIIFIFITFITVSLFVFAENIKHSEIQMLERFGRTEAQQGAWGSGKWGSGREEIWQFTIDRIKERPWFGYGIGSGEKLVKIAKEMGVIHYFQGGNTHNSYLTILVEVGIIGAIPIFLVMIIALFRVFSSAIFVGSSGRDSFIVVMSAIVLGCMVNALTESWMLSPGNMNILIFWGSVFFLLGCKRNVVFQEMNLRTKQ